MRWSGRGRVPVRFVAPLLALAVVAAAAANYLRPVPAVAAVQTLPADVAGGAPRALPWPAQGQAAVGAAGAGVFAASPDPRPLPIASVTKVMTALVVLEARPLKPGEQGPLITVTPEDVAAYRQATANGESRVAVTAGEQISELQALEAMLIPSGNNIAELLGRWALGSVDAAVGRMNARAHELGLAKTAFVDVSGYSARDVSVPAALVELGEEAMRNPVFAEVVAKPEAQVPVAGTVYNVNYALGQDGILGIKTGSTPEAGGVYLFAAPDSLPGGKRATIVGAVQGLATLDPDVFDAAKRLLDAVRSGLVSVRLVSHGQAVGRYSAPWGAGAAVLAVEDLDVLRWPGTAIRTSLQVRPLEPPVSAGTVVGGLRVTVGGSVYEVPMAISVGLPPPGRRWRLTRLS